jgi:two-component system, NarL family, response regulator LiaR
VDVARAVSGRLRSSAITIAIADGDPLARHALRTRLAAERDIEVVGEASDAFTAIELVRDQRPELVLIEPALSDRSSSEAIGEMRAISPRTSVIMLAAEADEDAQMQALRAGAAGCLLKSIDLDVLPRVLRGVRAGEAAVTRALGTRVLEQVNALGSLDLNRLRPVRSSLTEREWEVLDLLVEGATTREIASQLQVSLGTVRTHVKRILGKLGMHSRGEAIRYVKRTRAASWALPDEQLRRLTG